MRLSTIEQMPVLRSSSVMAGGSLKGSFLWFLGRIREGPETFLPTFLRDWENLGPPTCLSFGWTVGFVKGILNF